MSVNRDEVIAELQRVLREAAARLSLDPASITTPTPSAITGRARDGSLLRLDVSSYPSPEVPL